MINYDSKFEKLKSDFEKGIVSIYDLKPEEIEKLTEAYKSEIISNKKEIEITENKIKNMKNKIDNII